MTSFLQYMNEANSSGSKFEQRVADKINEWLKESNLSNKFIVKRYQTIKEENGNRDEDYSDIIVEDLQDNSKFFIECKEKIRDNIITTQFDIKEDYTLVPVKDKNREEVKDEILLQLANDIYQNQEYRKFVQFMVEETDWTYGGFNPGDYYFNKQDIKDNDLQNLIQQYNKMVKKDKVESDNKPFDEKLLRDSTRNLLAVALMWRLNDLDNTWDICHLKDLPYFGDLIRKHYCIDKEIPVKYIQIGENTFLINQNDDPFQLKCTLLPEQILGEFDLKFTPRFGSGSMYITPRSKITQELKSNFSFI